MMRIIEKDDRYPSGYRESIHPDEFVANENNQYMNGVDPSIDPLNPIKTVASLLFNKFIRIKNSFDKAFGSNPVQSEDDTPIITYEKMLKAFENAVPSEISFDFETRFNSMIGIINGNRKAGDAYIRELAQSLILKMVDAGENDLAWALSIEFEMKK